MEQIKLSQKLTTHPDMIDPLWVWILLLRHLAWRSIPKMQQCSLIIRTAFIGSLKFKRLYQLRFDETGKVIDETILLEGALGRIRDVAVTEEGAILILNDANVKVQPSGGLYRLTP